MPTVSSYNGVTVILRVNDHQPPHFHAYPGGDEAMVRIAPVVRLHGAWSPARLRDVLDRAKRHQAELVANWERCQAHQPVQRIG